jgi:hypothetical protein
VNRDFVEMLFALSAAGVEFLIVGAHALSAHGKVRATGDLDIWVNPAAENAPRVLNALVAFGAPLFDLTIADLTRTDTVFQIGQEPCRIDILTGISGVTWDEAWPRRLNLEIDGIPLSVLGRDDFVKNKRAVGRPKDRIDLELLGDGS